MHTDSTDQTKLDEIQRAHDEHRMFLENAASQLADLVERHADDLGVAPFELATLVKNTIESRCGRD